jgi:hypothetical protein
MAFENYMSLTVAVESRLASETYDHNPINLMVLNMFLDLDLLGRELEDGSPGRRVAEQQPRFSRGACRYQSASSITTDSISAVVFDCSRAEILIRPGLA